METDFVGYGTPVVPIRDDESLSKLSNENKLKAQKVKDKQGRERFHGAFTGGFSAGYYNTVGTEEGWTPSTFISSRKAASIADDKNRNKPEHFMDEEDLDQFGIAPRQIQRTSKYNQQDWQNERAVWDPVVPGLTAALSDVIKPVRSSIAVKLLCLMGWKHGQGIGPRVKRKQKKQSGNQSTVYGPALPSNTNSGGSSDEEEYMSHVTFAPKDMNPVKFDAKDDLHGIGYQPLGVKTSTKSSADEEERLTFGGHSRGITGKAFGVGIEEDEEDGDIYSTDKMSNYDLSIGDEPVELHSFTKPSVRATGRGHPKMYQSATVLDGFCLAVKKDKTFEQYSVPQPPRAYRPKAAVTGASDLPKIYGKMDRALRALIIGESVKDSTSVKLENCSESSNPLLPGKSADVSLNEGAPAVAQDYVESDHQPSPPPRPSEPLNKQSVDFKPFIKHPEKQARYERYLMLKRSGDRDAYDKVAPPEYRRHERDREREEFERSGKFFKDLSGVMASRFTRSKLTEEDDDSKISVRVDEEADGLVDEKKQAVKMKLFGKLTRESYEWHPHRLLCKRFNVPDPYPDSQLVGLPTVYKDKISAYNFLDIDSLTKAPDELKAQKEKLGQENEKLDLKNRAEAQESSAGPKSLVDGEKAPLDLFKAVFQNSDSDQSESSDTDDENLEDKKLSSPQSIFVPAADSVSKSTFQSLKEQYDCSRTIPSNYNDNSTPQPGLSGVINSLEPQSSEFKVKFVPKKDRHKTDSGSRKSRWSDSNVIQPTSADAETLSTSLTVVEESKETSKVAASTPVECATQIIFSPTLNAPSDMQTTPLVEPQTPPSEIDEIADKDCWMPALPPALLGLSSSSKEDKGKGHKDKGNHKHKKKKRKKSHKERRKQ